MARIVENGRFCKPYFRPFYFAAKDGTLALYLDKRRACMRRAFFVASSRHPPAGSEPTGGYLPLSPQSYSLYTSASFANGLNCP